jgi:hypothetical protein
MKKLVVPAIALLALLGACAEDVAPVNPRDAVLDAMQAVYEAGTFHQELDMEITAGGESFSFSGRADVDNERQRIDMTMDLGILGGEMRMLMDEGVIYMRSPAMPAETAWVKIDPSKLDPEHAAQFGGFGAGTTDPSAYAGLFAGVFDVEAAGDQDIGGVATTRYTGTIDLERVLRNFGDVVGGQVDPPTKEQLELAIEQFETLGIEQRIPFELWIDDEGLPRRQRITMDFGALVPGEEEATMAMTVDYSAFGEPVEVRIPPPSQVTDVSELAGGIPSG